MREESCIRAPVRPSPTVFIIRRGGKCEDQSPALVLAPDKNFSSEQTHSYKNCIRTTKMRFCFVEQIKKKVSGIINNFSCKVQNK